MNDPDKPAEIEPLTCGVCHKEVPASEATVFKAMDYIVFLCAPNCYDKWKSQQAQRNDQVEEPCP